MIHLDNARPQSSRKSEAALTATKVRRIPAPAHSPGHMEKGEHKFRVQYFWVKNSSSKKIHQELVTTPGADLCGRSQIKISLQKFGTGDLSYKDAPRTGRLPLTLGTQPAAFLQKHPFASARVLAQHFLTHVPTIRDILQQEPELKNFPPRQVPRFLSPLP
jgi:hypothetical protein